VTVRTHLETVRAIVVAAALLALGFILARHLVLPLVDIPFTWARPEWQAAEFSLWAWRLRPGLLLADLIELACAVCLALLAIRSIRGRA
jgi:hypothetical protein